MSNIPVYDIDNDPVINLSVQSKFYDTLTFSDSCINSKNPILLSINVQSLNAKHEGLKAIINDLTSKNIPIDIIVLQETWNIKYCNLLTIPGYHNILFKNRKVGRGGGEWKSLLKTTLMQKL
jgi:hypothetical protein